jgi:methyl-accepting chemotaxis protein
MMAKKNEDVTPEDMVEVAEIDLINMDNVERMADTLEASAKHFKMVLYPTIGAFAFFAIYGFYLIFTLSQDFSLISSAFKADDEDAMIERMVSSVENMSRNMVVLTGSVVGMKKDIEVISTKIVSMSVNFDHMTVSINQIKENVSTLDGSILNMSGNIRNMDSNLHSMTGTFGHLNHNLGNMQNNMRSLDRNISTPMNKMNKMIPFLP